MGEVFHAIHLESRASVAIKVVSRAFAGDFLMARLEREAAAAARIQSDFIPRLLDVDRTDTGELFLVMELLRGDSLADRLKSAGGVLPWEEVQAIGEHVLCGLIDAHAAGVIHRDLKPGNIFLEYFDDGTFRTRVLDFGVCKVDGTDGEKLTITGEAVGTIAYMAPEQIRGASKVDERADIYSFAMVIFEAVSGRLAFDASGQMAILASKLERPARQLRTAAAVPIPVGLDALVNKCLARAPGDRFPTARDVLKAWRTLGVATQLPSSVPIVSQGELNPPTQTEMTAGALLSGSTPRPSRSFLLMAGAVVVGGVIALTAMRTRAAPPPVDGRGAGAAGDVEPTGPASDEAAGEPAVVEIAEPGAASAAAETDPATAGAAPSARAVTRPRGGRPPTSAKKPSTAPTIVTTPRY